MGKTVCVRTYESRLEAELARTILEEAGIRAMVSADDCGRIRSQESFTSGGVRLLVLSENARRAAELLLGTR